MYVNIFFRFKSFLKENSISRYGVYWSSSTPHSQYLLFLMVIMASAPGHRSLNPTQQSSHDQILAYRVEGRDSSLVTSCCRILALFFARFVLPFHELNLVHNQTLCTTNRITFIPKLMWCHWNTHPSRKSVFSVPNRDGLIKA